MTGIAPPAKARQDVETIYFIRDPNRAQLIRLAQLVDSGKVRPRVGAVYPLAEAKTAFANKSNHGVTGKVILQP